MYSMYFFKKDTLMRYLMSYVIGLIETLFRYEDIGFGFGDVDGYTDLIWVNWYGVFDDE